LRWPGRAAAPGTRPAEAGARPARRPWWVWAAPFALTLGVLLARNAFLFSTPEYERADMGADSILIEQARRFTLLTGNYSRKGFNHPGPAFLYVESWGESVCWALLHAVPAAWNGQLMALYALNAAFAAGVTAVGYGWLPSPRGALAAGAGAACLAAVHPAAFSSDWMPYVYVPPFLLFTVALASTAAGHRQDAWIAALAGWFLIHGHAAFLVIVPAMAAVVVAAGLARRVTWGQDRPRWRPPRWRLREWLPATVISALFALPLILQVILHGDGNFARYFAYGSSSSAGGHTAGEVTRFVLWFWWPGADAWLAPLALALAAAALTARLPSGPARAFCRSLLLTAGLAAAMTVLYAATGVDQIDDYYIGYFSWAIPVAVAFVILLALSELLAAGVPPATGPRVALAVTAAAALAAGAVFAAAPATRTSVTDVDPRNPQAGYPTDPALPAAVARMAVLARGRAIVLSFPHNGWTDVTGLLVQAERTGVSACVADRSWAFLMSAPSICTPAELRTGARMSVYPDDQIPPGAQPVARLQRAIVTSGTKRT
jgi:hypothetical protein